MNDKQALAAVELAFNKWLAVEAASAVLDSKETSAEAKTIAIDYLVKTIQGAP